jgi:hypothetical protein
VSNENLAPAAAVDVAHLVADAGGHLTKRLVGIKLPPVVAGDIDQRRDPHQVRGRKAAQRVLNRDFIAPAASRAGKHEAQ